MSTAALVLLLLAACLHVGWNLLLKQAERRDVVTCWALALGGLLFLPMLFAAPLSGRAWALATASAVVEVVYFLLLAAAYARAEFSLVYPIARGAAPVLLAAWSALLLRETPTALGAVGIAIISLGLMAVGGATLHASRGVLLALGIALSTSVYSLIDGVAVRHADPAAYIVAIQLVTAALLIPVVMLRHGMPGALQVLRSHPRRIGGAGVVMVLSYLLVLRAYVVAPVAYVGAAREVSVVIGAIVGWRWLGEPFGPRRVVGALVVFAGIVLLAAQG